MKPPIAVWHDDRLPQAVIEAAQTVSVYEGLRHDQGVDICKRGGTEFVLADGYCGPHTDWDEISILWVARNDVGSWVGARGIPVVKPQPVGTVIVLDINHTHYLATAGGKKGPFGVWAGAVVASLNEWPSREQVEEHLSRFAQTLETVEWVVPGLA